MLDIVSIGRRSASGLFTRNPRNVNSASASGNLLGSLTKSFSIPLHEGPIIYEHVSRIDSSSYDLHAMLLYRRKTFPKNNNPGDESLRIERNIQSRC